MIVWLISNTYARKETVVGWLEPATGFIRIYPSKAGTIEKVLISEGQKVEKGQSLIVFEDTRTLADGRQLEGSIIAEYENQLALLEERIIRTTNIFAQREKDVERQIQGTRKNLVLLSEQFEATRGQLVILTQQVERYRALEGKNHVSTAALDDAIRQRLAVRADMQELRRNQVELENRLENLMARKRLLPQERDNELSVFQLEESELLQQSEQLKGQQTFVIRAPRSGIVSNLQAKDGKKIIDSSEPLLHVVPEDERLVLHALAPVRASGFVKPGQTLDVRFDAFPYQKFGLYKATATKVSDTVFLPSELRTSPVSAREPVFRITASLSNDYVSAYGREVALKPGMTLSADVVLENRTILQWILEPIHSLRGRI